MSTTWVTRKLTAILHKAYASNSVRPARVARNLIALRAAKSLPHSSPCPGPKCASGSPQPARRNSSAYAAAPGCHLLHAHLQGRKIDFSIPLSRVRIPGEDQSSRLPDWNERGRSLRHFAQVQVANVWPWRHGELCTMRLHRRSRRINSRIRIKNPRKSCSA